MRAQKGSDLPKVTQLLRARAGAEWKVSDCSA
jgi:hypothetical protein